MILPGRFGGLTAAIPLLTLSSFTAFAEAPVAPPQDSRELPAYMVPIEPDAAEAYWSPDSKYLIAQTRDPDALPSARGGLGALTYIFSIDGMEIRRLNDHGQDACSFFFPDGKRVVWTSTRDHMDLPIGDWNDVENYPKGAELYTSNLKGKKIKRLTNNEYYEAEVSVSPDGEWITFGRQIDGNDDIWIMRSDGTDERQVTHTDDWQEGAPFFLPDSDHIIFRAPRKSEYGMRPSPMTIFTIKKDGTDWRRHTYDTGMNWHPMPAPDGRHYVYVRAETPVNWEIYLGDLAGGEPKRLTYYDGFDVLASISPDGTKMNWGRGLGGFSHMRTFIMDVSSLDVGADKRVPFDPSWGEAMQDDAKP